MPNTIKKIKENITLSYGKKDVQTIKSWIDFVPPTLQSLSKITDDKQKIFFDLNIGHIFLPLFSEPQEKDILSVSLFNLIQNADVIDSTEGGNGIIISDPENLPIGKVLINLANDMIGDKYSTDVKYNLFILNSCLPEMMHEDNSLYTIGFSIGGTSTLITNRATSNKLISNNKELKEALRLSNFTTDINFKSLDLKQKKIILEFKKILLDNSEAIPDKNFGIWDGFHSLNGGVWHSSPKYCTISDELKDTRLFFGLVASKS